MAANQEGAEKKPGVDKHADVLLRLSLYDKRRVKEAAERHNRSLFKARVDKSRAKYESSGDDGWNGSRDVLPRNGNETKEQKAKFLEHGADRKTFLSQAELEWIYLRGQGRCYMRFAGCQGLDLNPNAVLPFHNPPGGGVTIVNVEHVFPKNPSAESRPPGAPKGPLFEAMWDLNNMALACSFCNGKKSNLFFVGLRYKLSRDKISTKYSPSPLTPPGGDRVQGYEAISDFPCCKRLRSELCCLKPILAIVFQILLYVWLVIKLPFMVIELALNSVTIAIATVLCLPLKCMGCCKSEQDLGDSICSLRSMRETRLTYYHSCPGPLDQLNCEVFADDAEKIRISSPNRRWCLFLCIPCSIIFTCLNCLTCAICSSQDECDNKCRYWTCLDCCGHSLPHRPYYEGDCILWKGHRACCDCQHYGTGACCQLVGYPQNARKDYFELAKQSAPLTSVTSQP